MIFAYRLSEGRLTQMPPEADLADAIWIDLYRPQPEQAALVAALGIEVPTLEDMEEIELSNRLYRVDCADYMTAVVPGQSPDKAPTAGPVTFIVTADRLISVRYHAPRPFVTFPDRADRSSAGTATHVRLFLGLVEEIIARMADLLEATGKVPDQTAAAAYDGTASQRPDLLQASLETLGREGEALSRVRLGLLTVERMLSTFSLWSADRRSDKTDKTQAALIKGLMRDINSLEVHADFLSNRVSLATEVTLGMINLAQNATIRIVSVVAALFLPPTLIASAYGMNFAVMPELDWRWGYPMALGMMVASAGATFLYFKWKRWL